MVVDNLGCDLHILKRLFKYTETDSEDEKIEIKKDKPNIETKKERTKKVSPKKKEKIKIVEKISKSILSKVKSLATKKEK